MQTKTLAGNNTPEFIKWMSEKAIAFEKASLDLLMAAYEDGVDTTHVKDYMGSIMEMNRVMMAAGVFHRVNVMKSKDINLPESEMVAVAAHEVYKETLARLEKFHGKSEA